MAESAESGSNVKSARETIEGLFEGFSGLFYKIFVQECIVHKI